MRSEIIAHQLSQEQGDIPPLKVNVSTTAVSMPYRQGKRLRGCGVLSAGRHHLPMTLAQLRWIRLLVLVWPHGGLPLED